MSNIYLTKILIIVCMMLPLISQANNHNPETPPANNTPMQLDLDTDQQPTPSAQEPSTSQTDQLDNQAPQTQPNTDDEPQNNAAEDTPTAQETLTLNADTINELNQQAQFILNNHIPEIIQDLRANVAILQGELEIQKHQTQLLQVYLSKNKAMPPPNQIFSHYQEAFNKLKNKHFQEAQIAFESFIKNNPTSRFAGNALFWLGEIARQNNQSTQAEHYFNQLIEQFPNHHNIPDTYYKMALIAANQQNQEQMQTWLQKIIDDYPNATIAQLARLKLKQLDQDNS
jgi:tol-pal system protein YbgF